MDKISVYEYSETDWKNWAVAHQQKPFVSRQILNWIYKNDAKNIEEFSNISKQAKILLNEQFYIPTYVVKSSLVAKDQKTVKFLYELSDGNLIETVIMHHDYGYSACLTTQVGCNMGCTFCASGQLRKVRNLTTSEIVLQLVSCNRYLKQWNESISRIVIMGIGEPFDNYDNMLKAMQIINNPYAIGLGSRKITISSCGLMDKMIQFAQVMPQVNLAISLHASNQELRKQIMPIARRYKFDDVIHGINQLIDITHRRITLEYILIKDVNDKSENAIELANLFKNKLVYVNLIPYNPTIVNPLNYARTIRAKQFQKELTELGIMCTLRQEFGTEINAACGQLRAVNMKIDTTKKN